MDKVTGRKEKWPPRPATWEAYWPLSHWLLHWRFDLQVFLTHRIFLLIDKLSSLSSQDTALSWFSSYIVSCSFSVSFAGLSFPPWPPNITVSQILALGPLLFPSSLIQWWCTQCHVCRSSTSSSDPSSELQTHLFNCPLENHLGWVIVISHLACWTLDLPSSEIWSSSIFPIPGHDNSILLVFQRLKTYKGTLDSSLSLTLQIQ